MNYTPNNIVSKNISTLTIGLRSRNIFFPVITFFLFFFSSINVKAQTIGVPTVSGTPVCEGSSITIQFLVTNGNGASNYFTNSTDYTVYLSNSSGSFALPTLIVFTNSTAPLPIDGSSVLITQ